MIIHWGAIRDSKTIFAVLIGALISAVFLYNFFEYFWGLGYIIKELQIVLQLIIADDDSWWPIYEAASARLYGLGIYKTIFFEDQVKFQYPPLSVLPFMVLIKMGMDWGSIRETAHTVSFFALFGIVFCIYKIINTVYRNYFEFAQINFAHKLAFFSVALFGTFAFHPIVTAQYLGQVQVVLDLLIALAFLAFLANQKHSSGALLAVAALIKPQFTIILVWALIRKEKGLLIGMLSIFIPAGIVSLYVFGFESHVQYLRALSEMSQHGEVFWPNQSINGLMNRLLSEASSLKFSAHSFAPYNAIVHYVTVASTIILLSFGLFYRPKDECIARAGNSSIIPSFDLATMLVLLTIAAPIAWYHHYGIFWPLFIVAFIVAGSFIKNGLSWSVVGVTITLSIAFILTSTSFPFVENQKYVSSPLNLLQSYYLYGAFIFLVALLLLRKKLIRQMMGNLADTELDSKSVT